MKNILWITMAAILVFFPIAAKAAMEGGHSGHGQGEMAMDHSGHSGEMIREVNVDGYALAYHLIDMREKIKAMKNMPEMTNTHHLMIYIHSPQGRKVDDARVGYLLQNPSGEKQKAMTMGMGGGYGADVNFSEMGKYLIKTKIIIGEKQLMDEFAYHVH